MSKKILVFQSDFGLLEGTVSQMHGIAMKVDPTLQIFDLTHQIQALRIVIGLFAGDE